MDDRPSFVPGRDLAFVPGRELARPYYWQAVRPILDRHRPGLPHAAGLVGRGSEVQGFDDVTSITAGRFV